MQALGTLVENAATFAHDKVEIFAWSDEEFVGVEIEDDGPGVSETFRPGVGRTLMGAFARQLRGSVEFVPAAGGGMIARMTFATPEAIVPTDPSDLGTVVVPGR